MKKLLFIFLLLVLSVSYVNAESCDTDDINRLKEIAQSVEISYEWLGVYESDMFVSANNYNIYISGVTDEIYLYEEKTNSEYRFDMAIDGVITDVQSNGKKMFTIISKTCDEELIVKKITLPSYNYYSRKNECSKTVNKKLDVCNEWYQGEISEEIFDRKISNNNKTKSNIIIGLVKNNYMYIGLFCLILIVLLLILNFKHRKQGALE